MEYAGIAIAVIALIVAFMARSTAAGLAAQVEEAKAEARRRAENTAEDVEQKLETMRRLMAQIARGVELSPDQIAEGRLWRDANAAEALQLVQAGDARVIDVRTAQETAGGIIAGAVLIPVDQLEARVREIPKDRKKTLIYCAGGSRSAAACEFLSTKGYENLYNLEGGFSSWSGPTARPK